MKTICSKEVAKMLDIPVMRQVSSSIDDDHLPRMERYANPLHKMLVSAQIDGVSLESASLLQRQYDENFGEVDPASDIHTDVHLLNDALIRRTYESKKAPTE